MEDTWASRDLPVLEAAVSQVDGLLKTHTYPDAGDIAAITEMDILDVVTALNALDGTYIELGKVMEPSSWHITAVTPAARRAVGQWPTGESLVERLAAGISRAAEQEQDPERKRRLLSVARELGGAAKTIAINVASELLEHRLPHGPSAANFPSPAKPGHPLAGLPHVRFAASPPGSRAWCRRVQDI